MLIKRKEECVYVGEKKAIIDLLIFYCTQHLWFLDQSMHLVYSTSGAWFSIGCSLNFRVGCWNNTEVFCHEVLIRIFDFTQEIYLPAVCVVNVQDFMSTISFCDCLLSLMMLHEALAKNWKNKTDAENYIIKKSCFA